MLKYFKWLILILLIIILAIVVLFITNRKSLLKEPLNYLIKYRVNHYLLKNSPWKLENIDISNFSSDKIFFKDNYKKNNQDKDVNKNIPEYIKKVNITAPTIKIEKKHNLQLKNQSPKQIYFKNINFKSNLKYPIENYSQEFTLNSESIFIDSKKIRESPVLALARNVITPKGVRIKNLKINGSCNLKSKICKFKDIRLGKRNLIISGSGYYNSGKSIGYFNFLIRFPKLPKLKLHMNISIKNSNVITKVEKLSLHKFFSMV